jgi:hypothetical protein
MFLNCYLEAVMEFKDLNHNELVALVGLSGRIAMADYIVSEEEDKFIEIIVNEVGEENYRQAIDEYLNSAFTPESFRDYLLTIDNQEARELIFATVFEEAEIESVEENEYEVIQWLQDVWNLKPEIEDLPELKE